jgi:hypothetical protein
MRSPLPRLPVEMEGWPRRVWWLRVGDAMLAWALAWAVVAALLPFGPPSLGAMVAAALVVGGVFVPAARNAWRPVSAVVAYRMSGRLRPGDRAWLVDGEDVTLVLVTARRAGTVVVSVGGPTEVVRLRRTRTFLVPAENRPR